MQNLSLVDRAWRWRRSIA